MSNTEKPSVPKCPECDRPLQNKLIDQCLYCGKELPDHLKTSDEEKAVIKQEQIKQLEAARILRKQKEAEEKAEPKKKKLNYPFL